ncbi:MAG: hypothetical protein JNK11_07450 [Alphaproteobacteria bacterium]|nr:hypothetical protein [Alphaproteobacteria bacterium]
MTPSTSIRRGRAALRAVGLICAAVALTAGAATAVAQQQPQQRRPVQQQQQPQRPAAQEAPAAAAADRIAQVEGFRTARFGMAEADVERSILNDLKVPKDRIKKLSNAIERTQSLVVEGAELLPESGKATVAYIFGFTSKKLTQVNILWGGLADRSVGAQAIATTADVLRNYFVGQNFPPEGMLVNARLEDGSIVVFRGRDAKGRMVWMRLYEQPVPSDKPAAAGTQPPKPDVRLALQLSYFEHPENPDIFSLKPGSF